MHFHAYGELLLTLKPPRRMVRELLWMGLAYIAIAVVFGRFVLTMKLDRPPLPGDDLARWLMFGVYVLMVGALGRWLVAAAYNVSSQVAYIYHDGFTVESRWAFEEHPWTSVLHFKRASQHRVNSFNRLRGLPRNEVDWIFEVHFKDNGVSCLPTTTSSETDDVYACLLDVSRRYAIPWG